MQVWDRRNTKGASGGEPVLTFNRPFAGEHARGAQVVSLRYSPQKVGALAILNSSGGMKIYETAKLTHTEPTPFYQGTSTGKSSTLRFKDTASIESRDVGMNKNTETIFVTKVNECKEPNISHVFHI